MDVSHFRLYEDYLNLMTPTLLSLYVWIRIWAWKESIVWQHLPIVIVFCFRYKRDHVFEATTDWFWRVTGRSNDGVHRLWTTRTRIHQYYQTRVSGRYSLTAPPDKLVAYVQSLSPEPLASSFFVKHRVGFHQHGSFDSIWFSTERIVVSRSTSIWSLLLIGDAMPSPHHPLTGNGFPFHSPRSTNLVDPSHVPSSLSMRDSAGSTKKILSREELSAIYDELTKFWFQEEWLLFDEEDKKTFLILNCPASEFLTVQMAIDQHYLTSGNSSLLFQPECLLVRTKSRTASICPPNATLSLEHLVNPLTNEKRHSYHLLAIICHSAETNSKLMFYKHARSDSWYVYYDQSIVSSSHSYLLSTEEHYQLESFIVPENSSRPLNHPPFRSLPMLALYNHPIVYVYLAEQKKKRKH